MRLLEGQTALVTGSSRGIGRAIALKLAEAGAEILIHFHQNETAARSVAKEISGQSRLLKADLRSPDAINRMIATLDGTPLHILVNNAGVWGPTPLGSTSVQQLDAMLETNLKGLFWITQAALALLADGANIINISSVAGRVGIGGGRSLYGATKAAVDSLTRSWALELAPRRIRVNAVAPGYVESDVTSEYFSDPEVLRRAVERSPFGRLGNADEVADVVLFLCSPAALWITGQSLNVSGGFVV
ncbi:MAG TPA: SDR family oxidoreductase [Terriglobales bacterium]|nr:SDR family oxidoreductase [Terriglobales bacterium]